MAWIESFLKNIYKHILMNTHGDITIENIRAECLKCFLDKYLK